MGEKDYYKILGVDRNASKEEIKSAYKRLAKQYHPDVNKSPDAAEKFKEINEAASVLGDDVKREQYDKYGSDFERRYHSDFSRDFSGFDFEDMDFGDLFEMFFGGGYSGRTRRSRGRDMRYDIEINLEEAATGVKKEIKLEKPETCSECNGRGGDDYEICNDCNGRGVKRVTQRTPFGIFQSTVTCKKCSGRGEIIKNVCSACDGEGIIHKKKTIEVNIPAGVDTGSQLRLKGEGEAVKNGASGDLYVVIHVVPHKYFERDGDDIILEVPITISQAILGDTIEIPTLDGKVELKIPRGTQPETILRLRGKGIKHLNRPGSGDQLVRVKVQIPEKLTKKQEDLIKEFASIEKPKNIFEKLFKK
ncbi:MAG: chaperone protein DnaJ [Candidatus Woesearchaeota archaeon]|nr:MAG: chaperone protein DnaJ [Candidatus Woesearchaeota archaeon]